MPGTDKHLILGRIGFSAKNIYFSIAVWKVNGHKGESTLRPFGYLVFR